MGWIDRVENIDGRLAPVGLGENGTSHLVTLLECKRYLYQLELAKTRIRKTELSLGSLEIASTKEYVDALGITAKSGGHIVYEYMLNDLRIVIPTALIICTLVGMLPVFEKYMFSAASLSGVALPRIGKDGVEGVYFSPQRSIGHNPNLGSLRARFTWLSCFPSAQRFWSSVYKYATQGALGVCLPNADVAVSFMGLRQGDTIYATRMDVEWLYPMEFPFPFAAKAVPSQFIFRQNQSTRERIGTRNKQVKFTSKQDGLAKAGTRWATSDDEWAQVVRNVKSSLGLTVSPAARKSIDLAIEKFGGGQSWEDIGAGNSLYRGVYRNWQRSGKWAILKKVLSATRPAAP